ncbi:unnamed protein product [Closterium sp. NIES-53]
MHWTMQLSALVTHTLLLKCLPVCPPPHPQATSFCTNKPPLPSPTSLPPSPSPALPPHQDAPFTLSEPLISRRIGAPFASTSGDVSPHCFALLRGASSPFLLCAAHWDCSTRLVAVSDGRTLQAVRQHTDVVTCLSADPVLPCKPHLLLCGHDDVVTQVLASSPLDLVLSASLDGSLLLHSLSSGRFIRCIRHPLRHAVQRMAVSQLALVAVHSDADGWLRVASINGKWLAAVPTGPTATTTASTTASSPGVAAGGGAEIHKEGAAGGSSSSGENKAAASSSSESSGMPGPVSLPGSDSTGSQLVRSPTASAPPTPASPRQATAAAVASEVDSVTCMAASACGEFLLTAGAAGRVTVRSFFTLATVVVYEGVGVPACSIAITSEDAILVGLEDGRLLLYSLRADALTD